MNVVIERACDIQGHHYRPHTWEWLNPVTMEPFRRGRVVFLCKRPK